MLEFKASLSFEVSLRPTWIHSNTQSNSKTTTTKTTAENKTNKGTENKQNKTKLTVTQKNHDMSETSTGTTER